MNINPKSNSGNIDVNPLNFETGVELFDGLVLQVKLEKEDEICLLFCSELINSEYTRLKLKDNNIIVGNRVGNPIRYDIPLIGEEHALMYYLNGSFSVEAIANNGIPVYVNDVEIGTDTVFLNNGDSIWLMGLNIIYINNYLFVNNPYYKVFINQKFFEPIKNKKDSENKNNENTEYERYIIRPPRIVSLDKTEVEIKRPKKRKGNGNLSALAGSGAGIGMAIMSMISMSQSIYNFYSGKTQLINFIFSLLMSISMLLSSIIIPTVMRNLKNKVENKIGRKEEKEYKKYIEKKKIEIFKLHDEYRKRLNYVYPTNDECANIIINKSSRLWERKTKDKDFLTVRVGNGEAESGIEVKYRENESDDAEYDELIGLMYDCVEEAKVVEDVPVRVSLKEKKFFGIVAQKENDMSLSLQNILLQLVTFHDYNELKIVFLMKNKNLKVDHLKRFPHLWNTKKEFRFWADSNEQFNEISSYLMKEIVKRTQNDDISEKPVIYPHYVLVIDDYRSVENLTMIDEIVNAEDDIGFSIIFLSEELNQLPNVCEEIEIINDDDVKLLEIDGDCTKETDLKKDMQNEIYYGEIIKTISNTVIRADVRDDSESTLAENVSFMELYNTNDIAKLNIWERWNKNDVTNSLAAPIGVDEAGNLINLDIHEKYHGPHGLIAGSTGSGKSEFIITYMLSLIINYHPDDVNFVLIDYKGGGLANAFKRSDAVIPHLTGTITNIDKSELERSLESLKSELKRRQIEFNNAKDITGESTIDIYKYQRYYHAGMIDEKISQLFIICDEFAELKQQEPEIMEEIMSIARIGRSLGVHLILATQKPSGVVNDQIRSNTKFGVCLKVQAPEDSRDVIGKKWAASLKRAGQFYFRVGSDDYIVLGQSGWAGAQYRPKAKSVSEVTNFIEFISNTGAVIKKVEDGSQDNNIKLGDQLTNIVKYVCELADEKNIHEKELWLESMPEDIFVKELRKKYDITKPDIGVEVVAGEYDDPSTQRQDALRINYTDGGNTVIYGNSESGKETLIGTMIYDLITNYSPDELNMYILDFGTETLKIFQNAPQVGDVILQSDFEKLQRLLMMMAKVIKERKKMLSKYGGNYKLFLSQSGEKMPLILIVINNYDFFMELYENTFGGLIQTIIRDGMNLGIAFNLVATNPSTVRYRMQQNFKYKIALKLTKDGDYSAVFDRVGRKRAANIFGRGLIELDKKIYEYQLVKICEPENWYNEIISTVKKERKKYSTKAPSIKIIPEILTINAVKHEIKDLSALPIGLKEKNVGIYKYNFKEKFVNIVSTRRLDDIYNFIYSIAEEVKMIGGVKCVLLDAENMINTSNQDLKMAYINLFSSLDKDPEQEVIVMIIGINKFIGMLGGEDVLWGSMAEASSYENVRFIVFESYKNLNNYKSSKWFSSFASDEEGIWIGPGFNEQFIIKADTVERQKSLNKSYGYAVKKGEAVYIKVLGMKEEGEAENG